MARDDTQRSRKEGSAKYDRHRSRERRRSREHRRSREGESSVARPGTSRSGAQSHSSRHEDRHADRRHASRSSRYRSSKKDKYAGSRVTKRTHERKSRDMARERTRRGRYFEQHDKEKEEKERRKAEGLSTSSSSSSDDDATTESAEGSPSRKAAGADYEVRSDYEPHEWTPVLEDDEDAMEITPAIAQNEKPLIPNAPRKSSKQERHQKNETPSKHIYETFTSSLPAKSTPLTKQDDSPMDVAPAPKLNVTSNSLAAYIEEEEEVEFIASMKCMSLNRIDDMKKRQKEIWEETQDVKPALPVANALESQIILDYEDDDDPLISATDPMLTQYEPRGESVLEEE